METYDKPFKTFDELLDILEHKHGLSISRPDEAKNILKFIPYYDLVNGYKEILMEKERFVPDIDFHDLFLFHLFDHDFQNALFAFSVSIEDYFKNILSYAISSSLGVDQREYLKFAYYLPPKSMRMRKPIRRDVVLPALRNISEKSLDNPTRYYRLHHNHVPPWILLKNTSFSLATNLFQISKREQKKIVLDLMLPVKRTEDQRYPVLLYILTLVRRCRNTIAHNLKFTSFDCSRYMRDLDKQTLRFLISPVLLSDEELSNYRYLAGVYGYIVLSLSLIPSPLTRQVMIDQLLTTLLLKPAVPGMEQQWERIRNRYYAGLHIPADMELRLRRYREELSASLM